MLPRWQHAPLLATAEIPQSAAAVEAAGDATGARSKMPELPVYLRTYIKNDNNNDKTSNNINDNI